MCPLFFILTFLLCFFLFSFDDSRQIPDHKVDNDYGNRQEEIPIVIGNDRVKEIKDGVGEIGGVN